MAWSGGLLTIVAENSSLNQILHEVSRKTGMKVTGGVAEERVFGSYGPDLPGVVLGSLLLGAGSNMLLKEDASSAPEELVLTPRRGGPSPPSPASFARDDGREDDLPPQRIVPVNRGQVAPASPPAVSAENGSRGQTPAPGAAAGEPIQAQGASTPAAASTTDQQSPNGVRTPQQIYDQLLKLQQQQKAAQPPQ